jgi:hypothetical protein
MSRAMSRLCHGAKTDVDEGVQASLGDRTFEGTSYRSMKEKQNDGDNHGENGVFGRNDGLYSAYKEHWFVCHDHKVR